MSSETPATALPEPSVPGKWDIWRRPLAAATALAFGVSTLFPLAAGLARDTASFPKWWGAADVAIAFLLAALVIALVTLARGHIGPTAEAASYRAYRALNHGLLAACVVYMLYGDRIAWPQCATGLAWRTWLLIDVLPAWIAASRKPERPA